MENKTREQLITELDASFIQVNKRFRQSINQLFAGDLTFAEYIFLKHLEESGPLRPSDIAGVFQVSLAHITTMCDRLLKKGFIYRKRPETDRRTIEIGLNEEGNQTLETYTKLKHEFVKSLYQNVTDHEIVQLVQIFDKVIASFEEQKNKQK